MEDKKDLSKGAEEPEKKNDAPNAKAGEKKKRVTMTKALVPALLMIGIVGGYMPYILAWYGRDVPESMGIAWVTEIVATILGYLCKAYFESKQEGIQASTDKSLEIEEEKVKRDYSSTLSSGGSG